MSWLELHITTQGNCTSFNTLYTWKVAFNISIWELVCCYSKELKKVKTNHDTELGESTHTTSCKVPVAGLNYFWDCRRRLKLLPSQNWHNREKEKLILSHCHSIYWKGQWAAFSGGAHSWWDSASWPTLQDLVPKTSLVSRTRMACDLL